MKRSLMFVLSVVVCTALQARAADAPKAPRAAEAPAAAASAAAPAVAGDPQKPAGDVAYPLPTMPMPKVASTQPAGKWSETEESPALRVSRAWVKLGEAGEVERSEATHRLNVAWKKEVALNGPHSRTAQAAYATFLSAYKIDLDQARKIYEGVLREVDAMDDDGVQGPAAGAESSSGNLAREATEEVKAAERDDRLSNSACFLSPDTCVQSDPGDKALQDEISGLIRDTLEAGGPDGGLSLYALRRKAGLLALRARVMAAVTQRAAARLATEVATAQDGQGSPRALPSPVAPMSTAARRAPQPTPADPYR